MNPKFINVPTDEDTVINLNNVIDIDGVEVLHQKWCWDGINAESFILSAQDAAPLGREKILQLAIQSGLIEDIHKITYTEDDSGFVFVNFNFRY